MDSGMSGHGGTVNGRTLEQVRKERERFSRMERENYAWKKGRPRMDPARFTLDLDGSEAMNVAEALTFVLGAAIPNDFALDFGGIRAARDQLREQLGRHAR